LLRPFAPAGVDQHQKIELLGMAGRIARSIWKRGADAMTWRVTRDKRRRSPAAAATAP